MPVQDTMQSLTAVAASNSPAGSDSISNTLDDYLRSTQAILRQTEAQGATLTSTASMSLAAATGGYVWISGTDAITHLGTAVAGTLRTVVFADALTLTHNSTNLILPGGANYTTATGDVAVFRSEGSGNWRCVSYVRRTGDIIGRLLGYFAEYDNGNSGAAKVVSLTSGQKQKLVVTDNCSLSISTSGALVGHYQLRLIQDATGSFTVFTNVTATRWLNSSTQPPFNTAANGETILALFWDGTNLTGSASKVGAA